MADRAVTYKLTAEIASFKASMAQASASTKKLANDLTGATKQGKQWRQGLDTFGNAAGKMGLVAAAGLGVIIKKSADFEQAMSNVAATGADAKSSFDDLRAAAIKAGASTAFSATEAAAGIENLAKAGVSVKDILGGGLSGALDLAAAGQMGVADAAELAATALTQFKLSGSDMGHVADLLAAGAGKAQGEVSDLGMALKQGGLVAAQMGLSIEETTGTLAAFASAGLLGSDAGTSLKTMLLRLSAPMGSAATTIKRLGIEVYDARGNFKSMQDIAGELQAKMGGLSVEQRNAAMATIFGSDAIRAASIIYDQGAGGVAEWTSKVNDAGFAATTAATRLDNLKGDLEELGGALETAFIGMGDGSEGFLRKSTQGATSAVNAFNRLPAPVKTTTTALLALTAVTGGAAFFGAKVVGGIASTRAAMVSLGLATEGATLSMRKLLLATGALGAAAFVGVGVLGETDAWLRSRDAVDATSGSLEGLGENLARSNVGKYASDLNIDLNRLASEMQASGKQSEYFQEVMADLGDRTSGGSAAMKDLSTIWIPGYTSGVEKAERASRDLDAVLKGMGQTSFLDEIVADTLKLPGAAASIGGAVAGMGQQMAEAATQTKEARDAALKTADSFVGLGKSLNNSKVSLSSWITELRKQGEALRDFRVNAQQAAKKGLDDGLIASLQQAGPEGAMRMKQLANASKTELGRANAAWRAGERQVDAFADAVEGVPGSKATRLSLTGAALAIAQARELQTAIRNLRDRNIRIQTTYTQSGSRPVGGQSRDALGSIHHAYALGDIANGHMPELAGPGPTRIWREPETQGEAYIPLANDHRRPRAQAIAAETVRLLGGSAHFADGGISTFASGGFTRSEFNSAAKNFDLTASQSAAEAARELRNFAREVKRSGGHLSKNFATLSKRALSVSTSLNRQQSALESLRSRQADARSGAASAFNNNAFGGTLADMELQLEADRNDSNSLASLTANLRGKGANTDFLASLGGSSNLGLIQELASASKAQVLSYQSLYGQRASAQASAGAQVAAGFTPAINAVSANIRANTATLERLEARVERGAERGVSKNRKASKAKGKRR